jgi:hypothetical protein
VTGCWSRLASTLSRCRNKLINEIKVNSLIFAEIVWELPDAVEQ